MFFMKDAAQQALDINIGRVLEVFRSGILDRTCALDALAKFFEGATDASETRAWLDRILERVDSGALETKDARQRLVKAALASEKHDQRYADILHQMAEV